ncbi:hypothetical protein ACFVFQ_05500 [Streptomyces sp. NPDC057743]|uniref:hypothetical protein n=1 Tax=Streptomyces sp. NPDC057743 TaxID=3346236 RepID=UPI0036B7AD88
MFEQSNRDEERAKRPSALAMPRQAPPVDRTGIATAGTHDDTAGVEADGLLTGILSKFLPF